MASRPAFQFYPGDWLRDPISGCSLAAQGLWLRCMIIAHDSERYGYLQVNGRVIPPLNLALRCGTTLHDFEALWRELVDAGIPRYDETTGIPFSKRMVDDETKRLAAKGFGAKGGNPALVSTLNPPVNPPLNPTLQNPAPSSSSSSSSSSIASSEEKTVSTRPPKPAFVPPTVDEVRAYCQERKNHVDPERFVDHYKANGWVQARGKPVKDWQACVRTWEKNNFASGNGNGKPEAADGNYDHIKAFIDRGKNDAH